ncbi:MAG: DUF3800 domain-containing protein [Cyanobacterium sp.]
MTTFHFYFDESGNFDLDNPQHDQIVGILVYDPNNRANPNTLHDTARTILAESYELAYERSLPLEIHGTQMRCDNQYHIFVQCLLDTLNTDANISKTWQSIRIVNKERIVYEDNNENYLYIIAELVLKIVQQKDKEGFKDINLYLYPASRFVRNQQYEEKIENILRFLQARQENIIDFRLRRVQQRPAGNHRLLQIADVLSNASYNNYNRCVNNPLTKDKLEAIFKDYNFTLIVPLFSKRVEILLEEQSYALALRFTLLEINSENNGHKAKEFLTQIINKLVELPSSERNAHLNYLITWLEQEINQKRDSENGYKLANKINKHIYANLREKLSEKNEQKSIIWFEYNLHFWALTACNHSGKLFKGSQEAEILDQLKSELYQQVEHLSLLMEGLIAQAVHYTDCFEFDKAIERTQFVIDFYDYFFGDEMQQFFTEIVDDRENNNSIKSDLRAKGYGTCLQAQAYKCLQNNNPQLLATAREYSDKAINEFVALNDKQRQYQYRSQLETVGGDFSASRQYLAKSLDLNEDSSYLDIMQHLRQLDINNQAFPLLHLFRLGYGSYFHSNHTEWNKFQEALQQSRLLINPWFVTTPPEYYPIHSILRRVASFGLIMKDKNLAQQALGKLNNLQPIQKSPIFGLIQIATYLEYAGLIWTGELNNDFSNLIAHKDRTKITITSLLNQLNDQNFEQMQVFKTQVMETVTAIQEGSGQILDVKRTLLKLANQIGY